MSTDLSVLGTWNPGAEPACFDAGALAAAVARVREPLHVVREGPAGRLGVALGGQTSPNGAGFPLLGTLPALYPEWLGDRSFCETHGVRFPYVVGEMARGITTARMVIAMARAGMMGFFGAGGLAPAQVGKALDEIEAALGKDGPAWGANLIHSPHSPELENVIADLYLSRGVRHICVSAFMGLTPAVVLCAAKGLHRDLQGPIQRRHHIFAKLSRPEVAEAFMSPAPSALLEPLVRAGKLSAEEAALAAQVPVAEDITAEADSGGHTDNRPLTALFPVLLALRDRLSQQRRFLRPIRVGAAGGLGTPAAVAAAFSLGAAYVVTGSVNQAAVESGLAEDGKRMLAEAGLADMMMAPCADMFELGVRVQVLRRGTMYGGRAQRLYDLYRSFDSLEALPAETRQRLESEIFGATCDEVWSEVRGFFETRDPRELERAQREPKHRMALVFRWYLGMASKWPVVGESRRRLDYQIWCGPAMGAFNDWVRGSFLEAQTNRGVVQIALNLLEGAAVITRAQQLRAAGVAMPAAAFAFSPRLLG
ncbi:MAG: PfaD family polyunsaturated fatty acid/polyketide biosynthesis protein [Polyangia bacterium]